MALLPWLVERQLSVLRTHINPVLYWSKEEQAALIDVIYDKHEKEGRKAHERKVMCKQGPAPLRLAHNKVV